MRLKGEKPHVVPSCGHNLHASCFEAVYGNISEARKTGQILGLCGVCRRDMRLGDMVSGGPAPRTTPLAMCSALMGTATSMSDSMAGKSKTNKFAAMAGLDAPQSMCHKTNSASLKAMLEAGGTAPAFTNESSPVAETFGHNPNDDDELSNVPEDPSTAWSDPTHHPFRKQTTQIVKPVIRAISESPSLSPHTDHGRAQHFTCMVSVEIPAKYPPAVLHPPASATFPSGLSPVYLPSQPGSVSSPGSALGQPTLPRLVSLGESESELPSRSAEYGRVFQKVKSFPTPTSAPPSVRSGKGPENERPQGSNLLQSIVEDLLNRIQDWKGHSPSDFGNLRLHDRLQVRKEVNSRDFLVYLFDEALLCVAEDQQRPVSGSSFSRNGRRVPSRSRLRLKGRVYIRHMSAVVNSSTDAASMLTIKMQDDNLEAFVMRFNDRAQLESWQTTIQQLIDQHFPDRARLEGRMPLPPIPTTTAASFDAQLSGAALESRPATAPSSDGGYASSSFTGYTKATTFTSAPTLFSVGEEDDESLVGSHAMSVNRRPHRTSFASRYQHSHLESVTEPITPSARSPISAQSSTEPYSPMAFNPAIGPFVPEVLPAIDLILMISIPSPANLSAAAVMPSSTKLKLRLLKESLTFVIGHLHPRSRISLVVYSVSVDDETNGRGQLKKTPFLAVGREAGRRRLEFVIDQIGRGGDCLGMVNRHNEGYYAEVAPAYQRHRAGELGSPSRTDYRVLEECLRMTDIEEERVSVVTAVNLAYDNILQRKQKNPLTGILLMHDTHDSSTKPQMALVMTRAEAANVPIHTIGWGKAHNPSCLWQLSNHTGGTYTFVKDLYSIKDTFTGCIGGMLSVGATNANLQLSVPEHRWFKIKKLSGVLSFVLSSDGQHADIELGELRYGERRDILVEMEMSGSGPGSDRAMDELSRSVGGRIEGNQVFTGTDAFFIQNGAGLKELGVGGAVDFYQAEFEQLSEDVPLLEVDASYRDPIAGKSVRRLVRPVLLSVTIGPTGPGRLGAGGEPGIVRRRIELLTSDSLTRALLLISRRMDRQAARLLDETRRIVSTVLRNMSGEEKSRGGSLGGIGRPTRNAQEQAFAKDVLMGCLADLETLLVGVEDLVRVLGEGLEGVADVDVRRADQRTAAAYQHFEALERNLGAQQAVVLRDQRAWTGRTLTERNFWKADLSMLYYMRCMHSSV
ncbi:hypothetical protein CROQUDRAFT_663346 [Cronartium quercuum f. sp. fusiforme G11]|uniref:Uncharacterized protein n=1 Tax=Cronartium quercuum f. sp. fusiforme G11 TaxID=708437 RepID=A0A9P6T7R9_9BASI|nr:hypothetical protein CROQUDRAFT_663346 [Cronartium quercuum f. sp. fusiforme G11]